MSKYLVYQIGCIECGVSSYPIALCETEQEAIAIQEGHPSTWDTEGGDGYVEIINLNTVKDEFSKAKQSWRQNQ